MTKKVWATGFALFSMFFGAGNIVFPLVLGKSAGSESLFAIAGLAISAVLFPLLGLYAMMLYGGDLGRFLQGIGKWPAALLLFVLQMSQGPAGSMPRLFTLMHASISPYLPCPLWLFSILIAMVILVLCLKPSRVMALLGGVLTPLLLGTLALLVVVGFFVAPEAPLALEGSWYHFMQGVRLGYQTTDLLAALLFATIVMPHLSSGKQFLRVSVMAAGLLMTVYVSLCFLAAHYGVELQGVESVTLLYKIAGLVLGEYGSAVAALGVFLACFTTALSLVWVFSDYLKVKGSLFITLGSAALIANLGFAGIVSVWGPILEIAYPIVIALCLWNVWKAVPRKSLSQF